jgi:hypothetical protein
LQTALQISTSCQNLNVAGMTNIEHIIESRTKNEH